MTNLKHIYDDHIGTDISVSFHNMYASFWKTKQDFIDIEKYSPLNDGRFRKRFDHFIKLYIEFILK